MITVYHVTILTAIYFESVRCCCRQ